MTDNCANCGAEITSGGIFTSPNGRVPSDIVAILASIRGEHIPEMCEKCGQSPLADAQRHVQQESDKCRAYINRYIGYFPMLTVAQLPPGAEYRVISMVTANATVGTGIFSELSQAFSDIFGLTNTETGMSLKMNSGEASVRVILARKAIALGANAVIGVDVDYGVTGNNAPIVNMQGTAVHIANFAHVFTDQACESANKISSAFERADQLADWMRIVFRPFG